MTNHHVIAGATTASVTDLGNGRTYPAVVVGVDSTDDLAVLQARGAAGLHVAPLGTSSDVGAGDPVVAIGNAGGVGGAPSAVSGTVLALGQQVLARSDGSGTAQTLSGMIEVSAAVRPGDSDGPLVDRGGRVIGIDTAATVPSATDAGTLGYATPIDRALQILRTSGIVT